MKNIDKILEHTKFVPFNSLHLDPNNPRIAPVEPPGYEDLERLFDPALQEKLEERIAKEFDVAALEEAIVGQGWVPMDGIVVWVHPGDQDRYVVVEGNRRTTALRRLRNRLRRELKKFEDMKAKSKNYAKDDLESQKELIEHLEHIVNDTEMITVSVARGKSVADLEKILPRIMGVRHLTGAKEWTKNAQGLYVLGRYQGLFEARFPKEKKLRIDGELVSHVAEEVSLGETVTRRHIQASAAFSHFRREYSDKLPEGESFEDTDYYSFELIARDAFLRGQFGLAEKDLHLSKEGEKALFEWAFAKPRPLKAEDSDNIFYRHENLQIWGRMKRYDDKHKTGFALRFDVSQPEAAPPMRIVEAEWRIHQAQQSPVDLIQKVMKQLQELKGQTLIDQAAFLDPLLDELITLANRYKSMIKAGKAVGGAN